MESEQTYRINKELWDYQTTDSHHMFTHLLKEGLLVPDTRLDTLVDMHTELEMLVAAIADAPRCQHELIDRHEGPVLNADLTHKRHPNGAEMWEWCEGAPELRALLDAIAKVGKEET